MAIICHTGKNMYRTEVHSRRERSFYVDLVPKKLIKGKILFLSNVVFASVPLLQPLSDAPNSEETYQIGMHVRSFLHYGQVKGFTIIKKLKNKLLKKKIFWNSNSFFGKEAVLCCI